MNPIDAAVVTVTQFHAGDAWNVIPEQAVLRGTTRAFRPEVQDQIEAGIRAHRAPASTRRTARAARCATSGAIRRRSTTRARPRSPREAIAKVVGARERAHRPAADDGLGGLRLHAAGEARAATSGSATARARAGACCTTRATTSTTRSCRSARATGRRSSSTSCAELNRGVTGRSEGRSHRPLVRRWPSVGASYWATLVEQVLAKA